MAGGWASALTSVIGAASSMYGSYQQGKIYQIQAETEKVQAETEQIQAETNALIYDAQIKNIKSAQKITDRQYRTQANVLRGQATTTAARNGLRISGSTANSISQSIMQLQMDNSYQQFNYKVEKFNAEVQQMRERYNAKVSGYNASVSEYKGKMAAANSRMQMANTALTTGADLYSKYWKSDYTNNIKSWFSNLGSTKLSGGFATTNQQILNDPTIKIS